MMSLAEQPQTQPGERRDSPPHDGDPPESHLIEIGFVIAGKLDAADLDAVRQARHEVLDFLEKEFGEFAWRISIVRREELAVGARERPVVLLEHGSEERAAYEWDFGIVITPADLVGYYKPFALGVVSRTLDLSIVSTARLDPQAMDPSAPRSARTEAMCRRLVVLILHTLGHLNGLSHAEDADNLMFDTQTVDELDAMRRFTPKQRDEMAVNLREIADLRLEEEANVGRVSLLGFYLRSAWRNRHELLDAVCQAKPWEFPFRLSRLTTAAVSAMLILLITAEAWDLAVSQTVASTLVLLVGALMATTFFVVMRQGLLVRRPLRRATEQSVVTNVSAVAIVAVGMLTTALTLFALTMAASMLLFSIPLIEKWATSSGAIAGSHFLRMATFVTSLGILIGALGASFEDQHHFRHITFVDEET